MLKRGRSTRGCLTIRSRRLLRQPIDMSGSAPKTGWHNLTGCTSRSLTRAILMKIRNSRIVQLLQDRQTLWVCTEQAGLVRMREGRFTAYTHPGKGTTHNYARRLCEGGAGDLLLLSCEWELIRFAGDKFSVPSRDWGQAGSNPRAVDRDPLGQVWVGSDGELGLFSNGGYTSVWNRTNEAGFQFEWLVASRTGGCWVAANRHLRKFESGRWAADLGAYAWTNRPIYGMCEDKRGGVDRTFGRWFVSL